MIWKESQLSKNLAKNIQALKAFIRNCSNQVTEKKEVNRLVLGVHQKVCDLLVDAGH